MKNKISLRWHQILTSLREKRVKIIINNNPITLKIIIMKKQFLLSLILAAGAAHAAVIYDNGPVVDASGTSVIRPEGTWYGWGDYGITDLRVMDDFKVQAGQTWAITSLDFYSYQTGNPNFTFADVTWKILSGDANSGAVVASGKSNLTNGGLMGYRVVPGSTDTARAIYKVQADVADFNLGAGTYWLQWSLTSSSSTTSPFIPPTSDGAIGNALYSETASGPFQAALDRVAGGGLVGVALPFTVNGTITAAVPEPSSYALLLAGLVGVAGVVNRRKQSV